MDDLTATHTVAVPAGEDTCVLLQVDIARDASNNGTTHSSKKLTWAEVWGSLMIHLDPAWAHTQNRSSFSATHYRSSWLKASSSLEAQDDELLLFHRRQWLGLTVAERDHLAAGYDNLTPQNGSMWDPDPPSSFLAAVPCANDESDRTTTKLANNAATYFGSGTAAQPAGAGLEFDSNTLQESDASLIAATTFELAAGESTRLCYVYGYVQARSGVADAQALIDKVKPTLMASEGIAANVSRDWAAILPSVDVPTQPWLRDETIWHSYVLMGAVTYDSFYSESIVDQGTAYRYDLYALWPQPHSTATHSMLSTCC